MTAYYNEYDKKTAAWLRELIRAGHIAPGIVDERSIEDVFPSDLRGFTQCHFFAGIGVWSYALRRAGWSDDRPVWTGSCPCQPFSASGKGAAFADERHLWPAFNHLIQECKPSVVFGEQVASKDADAWIDLVHTDLEAMGYAFGAVAFPSAGVGAPHIRDRTYWVADSNSNRLRSDAGTEFHNQKHNTESCSSNGGMGNANTDGLQGRLPWRAREERGMEHRQTGCDGAALWPCEFCGYGFDAEKLGRHGCPNCEGETLAADAAKGIWRDADWIFCRDGKWRPIEPGTFPLAHGASARVGRLRGYGNAVNAEAARVFIQCAMEVA